MSRPKRIALGFAVLVVGGLIAAVALDPDGRLKGLVSKEPGFADRSAGAWLADLRNPDGNTRAAAADKLRAGGADAVPVLEVLLKAPGDPEPRWRAADVLGQIGPPARAAGPALIAALDDPDPLVPPVAMKALAKLAPDVPGAVEALIHKFPNIEAIRAVAAFKERGAGAVVPLRGLFDHSDLSVRRNAIRTVGKIGKPSLPALSDLIALMEDPEPGVREQAAEACGDIGPDAAAAVRVLVKLLTDADWKVRRDAVRALGQMKSAAATAKADVEKLLGDPEAEVKAAAEKARRQLDDADLTGTRRDGKP